MWFVVLWTALFLPAPKASWGGREQQRVWRVAGTVVVYVPGLWRLCAEFPGCSGGYFPKETTFEEVYIPTSGPPPTAQGPGFRWGFSVFSGCCRDEGWLDSGRAAGLLLGWTCSGRAAVEAGSPKSLSSFHIPSLVIQQPP